MSLSRHRAGAQLRTALLCLTLPMLATAQLTPCPASITTADTPSPPAGWSAEAGSSTHTFLRVSLFTYSAGKTVFDLAPDSTKQAGGTVTQTWSVLPNASQPTYLRCRYSNTGATLTQPLAVTVRQCTFRYRAGTHGTVARPLSLTCR